MYYTDNSILPEYMAPLIITAAPYGPQWLPGDTTDLPLSWDEQVQLAVDVNRDPVLHRRQGHHAFLHHVCHQLGIQREPVGRVLAQVHGGAERVNARNLRPRGNARARRARWAADPRAASIHSDIRRLPVCPTP